MPTILETIQRPASSSPLTYTLAELGFVDVQSVFAHFDGTAAGGSFRPALTIRSQNGTILARVFPSDTLAAGDTADVTYAPFLRGPSGGTIALTGSDGIVVTAIAGGYNVAANIQGSGWSNILVKALDESVASSIVLQNDDELFFTAAAGAFYYVEALLVVSGSVTANQGAQTSWGEDADGNRGQMSMQSRGSATDLAALNSVRTNQSDVVSLNAKVANRSYFVWGTHLGNGGTFRLKWAQNVSEVTPVVMHAGSILRYRRWLG